MFQQMLNGSLAVLRRPSVATFEEYERNDLGGATLYVLLGAILAGLLGGASFFTQRDSLEQQFAELERELGAPVPSILRDVFVPDNILGPFGLSLGWTLVFFFVFLTIVFLIGRILGGTGAYGELAYDVALFWTPISVVTALLNLAAIGPLACVTVPLSLLLLVYNLYLTFLAVQAGMNLQAGRAVVVILAPVVLAVLACCGFFAVLVLLLDSLGAG